MGAGAAKPLVLTSAGGKTDSGGVCRPDASDEFVEVSHPLEEHLEEDTSP
eukprot:CAMPEP_0206518334 /NCGR_PEP_ID=MMETSP0324_2-20121206/64517_1 /ASSEMBLY_ACC=CAM_ASM_000836 /TAXON_ID=2866 /ORGANISM="Crypthecodinium cohnii, Strain Seligo" /LENGTH=49 /DNA_ID= /DNA_START= /DNA_END= /DNA_ORIENTATION=